MHVHQPHLWKNPLLWHLHRSPQRLHLGLFWEGDLAIISVLFRLIVYKHIKGAIWQLSVLSSDWFCTNTLRGQFDNYQCPVQIDYVQPTCMIPRGSNCASICCRGKVAMCTSLPSLGPTPHLLLLQGLFFLSRILLQLSSGSALGLPWTLWHLYVLHSPCVDILVILQRVRYLTIECLFHFLVGLLPLLNVRRQPIFQKGFSTLLDLKFQPNPFKTTFIPSVHLHIYKYNKDSLPLIFL